MMGKAMETDHKESAVATLQSSEQRLEVPLDCKGWQIQQDNFGDQSLAALTPHYEERQMPSQVPSLGDVRQSHHPQEHHEQQQQLQRRQTEEMLNKFLSSKNKVFLKIYINSTRRLSNFDEKAYTLYNVEKGAEYYIGSGSSTRGTTTRRRVRQVRIMYGIGNKLYQRTFLSVSTSHNSYVVGSLVVNTPDDKDLVSVIDYIFYNSAVFCFIEDLKLLKDDHILLPLTAIILHIHELPAGNGIDDSDPLSIFINYFDLICDTLYQSLTSSFANDVDGRYSSLEEYVALLLQKSANKVIYCNDIDLEEYTTYLSKLKEVRPLYLLDSRVGSKEPYTNEFSSKYKEIKKFFAYAKNKEEINNLQLRTLSIQKQYSLLKEVTVYIEEMLKKAVGDDPKKVMDNLHKKTAGIKVKIDLAEAAGKLWEKEGFRGAVNY